jgi:hypothetical protein
MREFEEKALQAQVQDYYDNQGSSIDKLHKIFASADDTLWYRRAIRVVSYLQAQQTAAKQGGDLLQLWDAIGCQERSQFELFTTSTSRGL